MNRILAPILLLTLLFPSLALGETVMWSDLVKQEGLYYKKLTEVSFTGEVIGLQQGKMWHGKKEGFWVGYWEILC